MVNFLRELLLFRKEDGGATQDVRETKRSTTQKFTFTGLVEEPSSAKSHTRSPSEPLRSPPKPPVQMNAGHRRLQSAPPSSSIVCAKPPTIVDLQTNLIEMKKRYGERHPKVAHSWNSIGIFHFRKEDYDKAMQAYEKAVAACVDKEACTQLSKAYANMGTVHWTLGRHEKALHFLQRAKASQQAYLNRTGENARHCLFMARLNHEIGMVHTLKRDFEKAMIHFMEEKNTRYEVQGMDELDQARCIDAMGKVYLMKGEYQLALLYHEEALSIRKSTEMGAQTIMTSLASIGLVHRARQDYEAAILLYRQILSLQRYDLLSKKGNVSGKDVHSTLIVLKDLCQMAGDVPSSLEYSRQAAKLVELP